MTILEDSWIDGRRFLARFTADATVGTTAGETRTRMQGELILRLRGESARRAITADRLALTAPDLAGQDTGTISILGKSSSGSLDLQDEHPSFRIEVGAELNYEALDRDRAHTGDCYFIPTQLPATAVVLGTLRASDDGRILLTDGGLSFACRADQGEVIKGISMLWDDIFILPLLPAPGSPADRLRPLSGNNHCPPGLEVNRRRLALQPIGFRDSNSDPNPSGFTAPAQFAKAQEVWGKCCIDLDVRPIQLITNATVKTSDSLSTIRATFTDADPDVIEVYFVDNLIPAQGGGHAGGIGLASCKVVMAEPNSGNPVLLAHELGHVLGLRHPGGSNSDAGTVMAPTGGANNPGTDTTTHFMCTNIANPVLETLADTCCLTHDIGDHFIRDFPSHDGSEPSVAGSGENHYAMSNVWNRLNDDPGTGTPPAHQNPARFTDPFAIHTNYLFAKVEQRVNLKVRDASVRFYLKHPGSGGGALTFLGSVAVPDALSTTQPQTVRIPWQVPVGTPTHSCIFAVVRSDAEPEEDPASLTWNEFETLCRQDNDWAQRNLKIDNVPTMAGGNIAYASPILIRIPNTDEADSLPLALHFDARRAQGLTSIAVEIPGLESFEVKPGEELTVNSKTPIIPGEDLVLTPRVGLPKDLAVGQAFGLEINPTVADTPLAGYAYSFQAAPPAEVRHQIVDLALAVAHDLAEATDSTPAFRLLRSLRGALAQGPMSLDELAHFLVDQGDELEALGRDLATGREGGRVDLSGAIERWRTACSHDRPSAEVLLAFRDLAQRLQTVGAELLTGGGPADPTQLRLLLDKLSLSFRRPLHKEKQVFFRTTVEDASGRREETRFPNEGHYLLSSGTGEIRFFFNRFLYRGDPVGKLEVCIEACEGRGRGRVLATYRRKLRGSLDEIRGRYVPGDERRDREDGETLKVFYRAL